MGGEGKRTASSALTRDPGTPSNKRGTHGPRDPLPRDVVLAEVQRCLGALRPCCPAISGHAIPVRVDERSGIEGRSRSKPCYAFPWGIRGAFIL
eukprot:1837587-Pyramimonas_sp.AAC.1